MADNPFDQFDSQPAQAAAPAAANPFDQFDGAASTPAPTHHFQVKTPDGHTFTFEAPADATPQQLDDLSRKAAGYDHKYPVVAPHEQQPGVGEQLLDATKNDLAGIAQGAAWVPDIAAEGVGKLLSTIPNAIGHALSAAGHTDAADWIQNNLTHPLANPAQIEGGIEKIAPTPDGGAAHAARFVSQLAGGAAGMPGSAVDNIVTRIVGEAPKIPAVTKAAAKTANQDFAGAADRQGISYMAGDVPNATKSRFATALSNLTVGTFPIADAAAKNIASASDAVGRAAGNIGTVTDRTGAGLAAQRGARQFMGDTAAKLDDLEAKIPIAADSPAAVSNTRNALSGLSQSFSSNPKLAAAFSDPKISKFMDALTPQTSKEATGVLDASGNPITRDVTHDGGLSWNDLRDFRTRVGQIIGQPGIASDGVQIGQLKSLYGALSDDIKATAEQNGKGALNAWTRWNNFARARADRIENVVSLILGKNDDKGAQTAFEAIQRLAAQKGGDPIKLGLALRSMPADEANSVRATILDDMAHASAGTQNDTRGIFSPPQFLTNWNKLSDRAKNILFTGEHRKALDDIAKVMSGMKSSTQFANSSKTGIAVAAGTNTSLMVSHPILGTIGMALQYGGGKLLASPAVARKIAGTPLNKVGAAAYWSRPWVKSLQAQNPTIAAEIQAFARTMAANDGDVHLPAAASQSPQDQQANSTQP